MRAEQCYATLVISVNKTFFSKARAHMYRAHKLESLKDLVAYETADYLEEQRCPIEKEVLQITAAYEAQMETYKREHPPPNNFVPEITFGLQSVSEHACDIFSRMLPADFVCLFEHRLSFTACTITRKITV